MAPSSKKLSRIPTGCDRLSTSCHIAASPASVSLRGATYSLPACTSPCGSGSPFRSTFPLAVSGIRSTSTKYDGTMYSGRAFFKYERSSEASNTPPLTTYAHRYASPRSSFRAITTASFTSACCSKRCTTSPVSIRYPRIFTCSSIRPMYSRFPSGSHLARSPVRYIRSPGSNGLSTNVSAVSSGRFKYPRARPSPAMHSSPGTPIG
ncbi:hypothetical protein D3C75_922770 [compost metagenome]